MLDALLRSAHDVIARCLALVPIDKGSSKLLAEIATQSVAEYGPMLTALVVHQDGSDVGGGFYKFAQNHPDLPLSLGASKVEKDAFWIAQLNAVHEEYSANRTRRQGFG